MKARVFVTLKPSVFDPQGTDHRRRAALARLRRRRRRAAGQVLRARARPPASADAGARRWPPKSPTRCSPIRSSKAIGSRLTELAQQAGSWSRELTMKFGVVVFPGSNCDHDAYHAAKHVLGQDAEFVWHKDTGLKGADVVILPGGFAHGDYLRTGAIARFSPIMPAIVEFARGRRPGARHLQRLPGPARGGPAARARCCATATSSSTASRCTSASSRPTRRSRARASPGSVLRLPIAHGEGNYYAEPRRHRASSRRRAGSIFRYCDARGEITDAANPNGSVNNIAGICNEARNVVGLMPHPERACESALGSADGLVLFESVVTALATGRRAGMTGERVATRGWSASCSRSAARHAGVALAAWMRWLPYAERIAHLAPSLAVTGVLDLMIAFDFMARYADDRHPRRIRSHRPLAGARADRDRARHLLGDVVRALQLQELAHPPEEAADHGAARAAGAGRERRRGRHRRRPGRGLQDRVAQPSVVHRAVPGRGDRRRRHHPRHLHDGRAADRAAELAALRPARRPDGARTRRIVEGVVARHRRLRQQHRHPDHRRRDCLRGAVRRQPARQRPLPRHRRRRRAGEGQGVGRRQPGLLRRREDRPRRHPWRDDGVGGVRREGARRSGRRCRSAIRSWRSCCSRPASS